MLAEHSQPWQYSRRGPRWRRGEGYPYRPGIGDEVLRPMLGKEFSELAHVSILFESEQGLGLLKYSSISAALLFKTSAFD